MDVDGSFNVKSCAKASGICDRVSLCDIAVKLTWENGLHFHHAVGVSRPHSTQEGGVVSVDVRGANFEISDVELFQERRESGIRRQSREAGVASGAIAVPKVDQNTLQRLTGSHVQHTNIQPQGDAGLILGHILTEGLGARPDIRSLGDFRGQHAGIILDDVVIRCFGLNVHGGVTAGTFTEGVPLPAFLIETCNVASTAFGKPISASHFLFRNVSVRPGVGEGHSRETGDGQKLGKMHDRRTANA